MANLFQNGDELINRAKTIAKLLAKKICTVGNIFFLKKLFKCGLKFVVFNYVKRWAIPFLIHTVNRS